MTRSGRRAFRDRRQYVLDIGLGGEFDRRRGSAQPLRAQPHLRDGFLARHIDDAVALVGERCGGLHQKRRLADAGIAADENRRAAHEAAAGGAVEFGDARRDARRVLDLARQRGQRDRAALSRGAQPGRTAADAARRAFLDQRVPLAAGVAFSRPALMRRAATLADELDAGFSHSLALPLAGSEGSAPLWPAGHLPLRGGDQPCSSVRHHL